MRLKFPALIIGLAILIVSCSKEEDNQYNEPSRVEVNTRISAHAGSAATVSFDALVSDSRCPANSVCVWAGIAIGKFTLRDGVDEYPFMLSVMPGYPKQDTIIKGYVIELVDIKPYPGMGSETPVKAEINVSKLY